MSNEIEVTATLENWDYAINTMGDVLFFGEIHNDVKGRWRDGMRVRTSIVQGTWSSFKEGDVVHTQNSTYQLGKKLSV